MDLRIEIRINDETPVVAGRPALDVLAATITFVRSHDDLELRAGGMRRLADGGTEHLEWVVRKLSVGDEIRFRVCDSEASSEPISLEREDGQSRERHEREYYEQLKKKYERS